MENVSAAPPRPDASPNVSLRTPRLGRTLLAIGLLVLSAATGAAAEEPRIVAVHLGLGGQYKLGCWAPLRVVVEGGDGEPLTGLVQAVTPDSDGVNVGVTTPGGRPIAIEPGRATETLLYVRVGQMHAPIDVKLLPSNGRLIQRLFSVDAGSPEEVELGQELPFPTATSDWLALQLGADCGVSSVTPASGFGDFETTAALVTDARALPRDAIGYDSFDVVLLAAGSRADGEGGGWLGGLSPDDSRLAALNDWVQGGGRLVLSCGAGGATLLAPEGALARLAPGTYDGPGSLSIATPLEAYAESDAGPIDLQGGSLPISELKGVAGVVEAFAGRSAAETPLVVRTPRGFGEVTFVACDLDHPALAGWDGRRALLKKLLSPLEAEDPTSSQYQADWGQGGLVNQLVERLDTAFTGVKTAPFLLIVGLVLFYLLLIGPGDYFFVKNVLKRVEATWITFPLIVIATSAAAYAGAYWLKGDKLRINQVEIIDIDSANGQTRGLLLTHLFSPRAVRYDLSLTARSLSGDDAAVASNWSGWLGKTGGGLGGMEASGSTASVSLRPEYAIDPTPRPTAAAEPSVNALPVQVWSTKSLVSRYRGSTQRVVEATLAEDGVGGIEGQVTNDTGATLTDCRLLFGAWSWSLGTLGDGESASIDPAISPIRIKKLLGEKNETLDAFADRLTFGSLATGARGPASRYLHDLDLAHHLEAGKALLVARVEGGPISELTRGGEPLLDDSVQDEEGPSRKSWVYARFLLPVQGE